MSRRRFSNGREPARFNRYFAEMLLADIDKLDLLEPRASVIWRGSPVDCQTEAPLFVIGSAAQKFIEHHRNGRTVLPAPAIYAIDDAEIHGLGGYAPITSCWGEPDGPDSVL